MSNREKLIGVWAVLFLGLFCVRCAQSDGYRYSLRGDIEGIKYGKAYLMTPDLNNPIIVDSSEIEDGKFLLEGTLDEPGQYVLSVNRRSFYFFMDGTEMDIVCPYEKLRNDYLKGSPSNDLDIAYNKMIQQEVNGEQNRLLDEYKKALEANNQKLSDYMNELGIEHEFIPAEGGHNFDFWRGAITKILDWLPHGDIIPIMDSGDVFGVKNENGKTA